MVIFYCIAFGGVHQYKTITHSVEITVYALRGGGGGNPYYKWWLIAVCVWGGTEQVYTCFFHVLSYHVEYSPSKIDHGNDLAFLIVFPVRMYLRGILWFSHRYAASATPCPQTLHRSHDNLKNPLSDCFHILYVDWYRWEDSWEARWARSDYFWAPQGPPNSQKCTFLSRPGGLSVCPSVRPSYVVLQGKVFS